MSEDQQLLHRYVQDGSRTALDALIRRHLPMVYSSALRQMRDPHEAEDVTQAVFLILARKAKTIRHGVAVGGWLLSVTRCAAVNAMKKRSIQLRHERLAAKLERTSPVTDDWDDIAPLLDAQMNRLAGKDRDAIVLRFFHDRNLAEVGLELGMTEEAARKRVTRALTRLRDLLTRQGVSIPQATLTAAIAAHAVGQAPAHLTAGAFAALGTGAMPSPAQSISIAKGALNMMAWAKVKMIGAVLAAVLLTMTSAVFLAKTLAQQPPSTQQPTIILNVPATPPATTDLDTAPHQFVLGSQDLLDLDLPLAWLMRPEVAKGPRLQQANPAIMESMNKTLQQLRADTGSDIAVMYVRQAIMVTGKTTQTATMWIVMSYNGAVITTSTAAAWNTPDPAAINASIIDWQQKNPKTPRASQSLTFPGSMPVPQYFAARTHTGSLCVFRITKAAAPAGNNQDGQATIEVKKVEAGPPVAP